MAVQIGAAAVSLARHASLARFCRASHTSLFQKYMGHQMITLGIHDGHTATAAIAKDGKVIACISEERLVREKEWGGFPAQAIKLCLEVTGVSPSQVDGVGYASLMPVTIHKSYDSPTLYKRLFGYATRVLPDAFLRSSVWVRAAQKLGGRKNKEEHRKLLANLG